MIQVESMGMPYVQVAEPPISHCNFHSQKPETNFMGQQDRMLNVETCPKTSSSQKRHAKERSNKRRINPVLFIHDRTIGGRKKAKALQRARGPMNTSRRQRWSSQGNTGVRSIFRIFCTFSRRSNRFSPRSIERIRAR